MTDQDMAGGHGQGGRRRIPGSLSRETRYVLSLTGIVLAAALASTFRAREPGSFLMWTVCGMLAAAMAWIYVSEAVFGIGPQGAIPGLGTEAER